MEYLEKHTEQMQTLSFLYVGQLLCQNEGNLCIPEVWAFEFHQPVFLKSNIGWPQQPPTEEVLKFNMSFHDSVYFFFKTSK